MKPVDLDDLSDIELEFIERNYWSELEALHLERLSERKAKHDLDEVVLTQ